MLSKLGRPRGVYAAALTSTALFVGCSARETEEPSDDVTVQVSGALTATQAIAQMTCNGGYVLNYNAPNQQDFAAIANRAAKPAFIVVDDTSATTTTFSPTDPNHAPGFFHGSADPSVKAIKVLKYIPMNYGQQGHADIPTSCS